MEAQELEAPGSETQPVETELVEAQDLDHHYVEAQRVEAHAFEAQQVEGRAIESHASEAQLDEISIGEDETQLAAIRELMMRAFDRGVWLTLGEIAEVTEFGEASISAQLRHLRKEHHGGYRVEKRRRWPPRAAAATRKVHDARRGPVIWEYRVLPPA